MLHSNDSCRNLLRVLTYHRVAELDETPHLNPGLISASPAMFVQQMEILARHYNVVSMEDLLDVMERRRNLPDRAVLVTFDDGYRDFAVHSWPVLRKLKLPVTVFIPTAYPDQPERMFWWDKLHQVCSMSDQSELATPIGSISLTTPEERQMGLKKLQGHVKGLAHEAAMNFVNELHEQVVERRNTEPTVLGWEALAGLANEGVTLGAHTRTHPILTRLSLEKARTEIIESQADLRREIGEVLPIFSYPDGGHTQAIVEVLKGADFRLGFNGPSGVNDLNSVDPFRIRRINVTRKTTPFIFRLRLSPWFSTVEKFRSRKRFQEISISTLH